MSIFSDVIISSIDRIYLYKKYRALAGLNVSRILCAYNTFSVKKNLAMAFKAPKGMDKEYNTVFFTVSLTAATVA